MFWIYYLCNIFTNILSPFLVNKPLSLNLTRMNENLQSDAVFVEPCIASD